MVCLIGDLSGDWKSRQQAREACLRRLIEWPQRHFAWSLLRFDDL